MVNSFIRATSRTGSNGHVPSLPAAVSWVSEAELSLAGLVLVVVAKCPAAWCALLRFLREDHIITTLSSDLSTSLRNVERSGSAWRSRKENEPVLGLVLKTELEHKFIFSSRKDHSDREIKGNELPW